MMLGGTDSCGRFKTHIAPLHRKPFRCDSCRAEVTVAVQYYPRPPQFRGTAVGPDLILGKGRLIGVTCGCYTKGHRQVARIDERAKP